MISALLTTLNNWKAIGISIAIALFSAMFGLLKYRTKQLEEANEEIEAFELKDEIRKEQDIARAEIISKEQDDILDNLSATKTARQRTDEL